MELGRGEANRRGSGQGKAGLGAHVWGWDRPRGSGDSPGTALSAKSGARRSGGPTGTALRVRNGRRRSVSSSWNGFCCYSLLTLGVPGQFADKEYPWSLGEVNGGGISRHTEVVGQ